MSEGPPEPTGPQTEIHHYALFLRHDKRFVWRLKDEGVTLEADRIVYSRDGREVGYPYTEIASINLSSAHVPRSGVIGQCTITFRNGAVLGVSTAGASGTPDWARTDPYRDFVSDLHGRLVAAKLGRGISFVSGMSAARSGVLAVALAAAAALFVALPLVLGVIVRSWEPLWLCLPGLALVVPGWRIWQKNRPASYDPSYPPDLMA